MANFGDIGSGLSIGASQSVRRNSGDSAFEAYTPGAGAYGQINYYNITTSHDVSVVSAGTFYELDPTVSLSGDESGADSPAAGRLRYTGAAGIDAMIECSITWIPETVDADTHVFGLAVSGGTVENRSRQIVTPIGAGDYFNTSFHMLAAMTQNQYVSAWGTNTVDSSQNIRVYSLSLMFHAL